MFGVRSFGYVSARTVRERCDSGEVGDGTISGKRRPKNSACIPMGISADATGAAASIWDETRLGRRDGT